MCNEVGLHDKVVHLNNEDKSRLYAQVIHVGKYQRMNGGPLKRKKYVNQRGLRINLVNKTM